MALTKITVRLYLVVCLIFLFDMAFAQKQCSDDEARNESCGVGERCVVSESQVAGRLYRETYCRADISEVAFAKGCLSNEQLLVNSCLIEWNGPITQANSEALVRFLRSLSKYENPLSGPMVNVRSDGGSVPAAIELGRQLRESTSLVNVADRCASACVLLLSGGARRTTFEGQVEIHRPYSLDTSRTDLTEIQKIYDDTNQAVAKYLRDMNLPGSLLDAMLRVPPHQGRRLSETELESFGLNQDDPVFEQAFNAYVAEKRGLTMMEYLSRKQLEEACIDKNPDRSDRFQYCRSVWD